MRRNDGSTVEVLAVILPPQENEGHGDWSCIVRCPSLFASDKSIAGADAEQSLELSEMFVREIFAGGGCMNRDEASDSP